MQTTIFRNENKVSTKEVLSIFNKTLKNDFDLKQTEIEELTEIMAKNPVDKFIVSEKPTDPVMQGDLLIWSEDTEEFRLNFPNVQNLSPAKNNVLQEDDSITGDHELVTLKNAKYSLMKGYFIPHELKEHFWEGRNYSCKILDIDSPFIVKHREHGNITFLTKGKYMICSSTDSETLTRMRD